MKPELVIAIIGAVCAVLTQLIGLGAILWRIAVSQTKIEDAVAKTAGDVIEAKNQIQEVRGEVKEVRAELRQHTGDEMKQFQDLLLRQTGFNTRLNAVEAEPR